MNQNARIKFVFWWQKKRETGNE